MSAPTPDDVLQFWFGEPATSFETLKPKMRRWFQGGPEMDAETKQRFGQCVEDAIDGRLDGWLEQPKGWLALVITLDQFTRNVLRDNPRMYAGDVWAQTLALEALEAGRTHALPIEERHFALMPIVHSETLAHQERAIVEFALLVEAAPPDMRPLYGMGVGQTRKYRDVIARFGRFPHRNTILGRESTPEEIEFLADWKQAPTDAAKLTT